MGKRMCVAAAIMSMCLFGGCLAVDVGKVGNGGVRIKTEEKVTIPQARISGVAPSVNVAENGDALVSLNLLGDFEKVVTTTYSDSSDRAFFVVGFFPGVMSCEGEYADCLGNGAGAVFYNLVFAGLPTVYGLVIEPFVPYYPRQTPSIFSQKAFLQSPLIGFARYSKHQNKDDVVVTRQKHRRLPIEDVVLSIPSLGVSSYGGGPVRLPRAKIPADGNVDVKMKLPHDHPLKSAMSDFENLSIRVHCK